MSRVGDTCTPVYGLPYPTGASQPCNIAPTSCDFATAVEAQLNGLDAIVERTSTTIPFAWIRVSTAFNVTQNAQQNATIQPPFDTVVVDTDNMVDLIGFNGISITRGGLYLVWMYVRGVATVVTVTDTNVSYNQVVEPVGTLSNIWFPDLTFTQVQLNQVQRQGVMSVLPLPAGSQFSINFQPLGFATDTITYSATELALAWVGDLP